MGSPAWEALTKAPGRLTRSHFVLITLIVVIFVAFFTYPPKADLGTYIKQLRRPHQDYISSKDQEQPEEEEDLEDDSTSTSTTTPHTKGSRPSKIHQSIPPELPETFDPITDMSKIYPPPPPADDAEYLAVCLLVKDVPSEMNEFFTHHYYHHGIRRFYIYDDGSSPPLSEHPTLSNWNIPESSLNFSYIEPDSVPDGEEREYLQQHTMERCIREHGSKHHWLALLDPDEFVQMRHAEFPILLDWLRHWEKNSTVGGLAISWLPHTSANHTSIPSGGFRKNYNKCVSNAYNAREDFWLITHSKSFVRPQFVDSIPNIHIAGFNTPGMTRIGEQGDDGWPVSREPPTHEYWGLHHYATGSREYFEMKAGKGRSQGEGKWPIDEAYWERYHGWGLHEYTCEEMTKYIP